MHDMSAPQHPLLLLMMLVSLTAGTPGDPPACTNLTGYWTDQWQDQVIRQTGASFSVLEGTGQSDNGTVSGSRVTLLRHSGDTIQGTLEEGCAAIRWDGGGLWVNPCPVANLSEGKRVCGGERMAPGMCCPPGKGCARVKEGQPCCVDTPKIDRIHVVYMTHLDLGFTNTTHYVCDAYFKDYFPAALKTAADLKARGGEEQFSWTEFPWIIQEYLDGAAGCGTGSRTPEEIALMEKGIRDNAIIWQANAVNFLTEVLDGDMWDESFSMRDALNKKYNKTWGSLAGKLTDTTGMSRAALPALHRAGLKAFHIGYNGVGGLPEVEPTFLWQDPASGAEILTMIEADYGTEVDLPPNTAAGVTYATGSSTALVYLYTVDNVGPPTAQQVLDFWASLREKHPEATIFASSLDNFTAEAVGFASQLPVVTSELGDSWHYGAPSDPVKVATFREARRVVKSAVAGGRISKEWPEYQSYFRRLIKGPAEHNWGLSVTDFLPELREPKNWDNPGFHSARGSPGYLALEKEWAEQRQWVHPLPLPASPTASASHRQREGRWAQFLEELDAALQPLMHPQPPEVEGMPHYTGGVLSCGGQAVQVDVGSGAVVRLSTPGGGRDYGSANLGRVSYRTYSSADFDTYASEYAGGDFGKQGVGSANPVSAEWNTTVSAAWASEDSGKCRVVLQMAFPPEAHSAYGAPGVAYVEVGVPGEGGAVADFNVSWFNKTATRLPESLWVSFAPAVPRQGAGCNWTVGVLGSEVDPMGVARGGTRFKHFAEAGVTLHEPGLSTLFEFVDTGLVSPTTTANMLRFCRERGWGGTSYCTLEDPALGGGMHANLHNNLWGTAFPQWYDDDGLARFHIRNT